MKRGDIERLLKVSLKLKMERDTHTGAEHIRAVNVEQIVDAIMEHHEAARVAIEADANARADARIAECEAKSAARLHVPAPDIYKESALEMAIRAASPSRAETADDFVKRASAFEAYLRSPAVKP